MEVQNYSHPRTVFYGKLDSRELHKNQPFVLVLGSYVLRNHLPFIWKWFPAIFVVLDWLDEHRALEDSENWLSSSFASVLPSSDAVEALLLCHVFLCVSPEQHCSHCSLDWMFYHTHVHAWPCKEESGHCVLLKPGIRDADHYEIIKEVFLYYFFNNICWVLYYTPSFSFLGFTFMANGSRVNLILKALLGVEVYSSVTEHVLSLCHHRNKQN